jgi:hypothetical protein
VWPGRSALEPQVLGAVVLVPSAMQVLVMRA